MTRMLIASTVATAALLSACGGGGSTPHVATATGSHPTTTSPPSETQILRAAAQCIRDHGVTNFPDPVIAADGSVQYDKQLLNSLPDSVSHPIETACQPQISAAQQYVDRPGHGNDQPATPQELEDEKKFAQCMRQHGYPQFPDPDPQGGFQFPAGSNPPLKGSPAFQACRTFLSTGRHSG